MNRGKAVVLKITLMSFSLSFKLLLSVSIPKLAHQQIPIPYITVISAETPSSGEGALRPYFLSLVLTLSPDEAVSNAFVSLS
jgi:hypothetical protein